MRPSEYQHRMDRTNIRTRQQQNHHSAVSVRAVSPG